MSITFACKKIMIEDLIRCAFQLNKTEYKVLLFLLKEKKETGIKKIAKSLNLKRCSIQKAVKNLLKKELIKRTQKNLSSGGYLFFYSSINKKSLKERLKNLLYGWYKGAEKAIGRL